jgi:SAM-dependent methyltransferase
VARLERLEKRYREHHRAARAPDFVFARPERTALFRRLVGGPGRRVLDVGCRSGALTRSYLEGNDVVGLDVDCEALAEAAKLGIDTHWGDAEEPLPFDGASFDVAVAGEVLEHLREPALLVAEARRVLRPGGTLVGSVPNSFRLKNRLRFVVGRAPEDDPTLLHLFVPRHVRALLGGWTDVQLHFVAGRFIRLQPRLFAKVIVFAARKPLD